MSTDPLSISMSPKISVILPYHNVRSYLKEAVESILNQTFSDFELILIDDASTDGSSQIIDEIDDARIVRITNNWNLGLAASLNRGLEVAQGEYIARMDGDDISLPRRLAAQIECLMSQPDVGVIGSGVIIFEEGQPDKLVVKPSSHGNCVWSLVWGNPFIHPSVLMRRKILEDVGGYRLKGPAQDRELWIRLYRKTRFANTAEPLVRIRVHPTSITSIRRMARRKLHSVDYREPDLYLRHRFLEDLLCRPVSMSSVDWLTRSQTPKYDLEMGLEDWQIVSTIALMLEAFNSMKDQGFVADDLPAIHHDLVTRIVRASRSSPQCVIPSELKKVWRRPVQRRMLMAFGYIGQAIGIWPRRW